MPSTRHYSNRQILYSTSEKLKRILLGLLDRAKAVEGQNRTRRAISRAKTTAAAPRMPSETRPPCLLPLQSMLADCLPSSLMGAGQRGRPEVAIDTVESLAPSLMDARQRGRPEVVIDAVESLTLTWSEGQGSAGDRKVAIDTVRA